MIWLDQLPRPIATMSSRKSVKHRPGRQFPGPMRMMMTVAIVVLDSLVTIANNRSFVAHLYRTGAAVGPIFRDDMAAVAPPRCCCWWRSAYNNSSDCRNRDERRSPVEFCRCFGAALGTQMIRNCFAIFIFRCEHQAGLSTTSAASAAPLPSSSCASLGRLVDGSMAKRLAFPRLRVHNNVRLFLRVYGIEFPIYYHRVVVGRRQAGFL